MEELLLSDVERIAVSNEVGQNEIHAAERFLGIWDPHIVTDDDSVLQGRGAVCIDL
jgi:hypothetical protein